MTSNAIPIYMARKGSAPIFNKLGSSDRLNLVRLTVIEEMFNLDKVIMSGMKFRLLAGIFNLNDPILYFFDIQDQTKYRKYRGNVYLLPIRKIKIDDGYIIDDLVDQLAKGCIPVEYDRYLKGQTCIPLILTTGIAVIGQAIFSIAFSFILTNLAMGFHGEVFLIYSFWRNIFCATEGLARP